MGMHEARELSKVISGFIARADRNFSKVDALEDHVSRRCPNHEAEGLSKVMSKLVALDDHVKSLSGEGRPQGHSQVSTTESGRRSKPCIVCPETDMAVRS